MPPKIKEAKSKAGRRGNNEGSIYQREDRPGWFGSVTTGYKTDGKPIRKTISGKSRQEVAKLIAKLTDEVYTNGYTIESAVTERNFEVLCREWFDLYVASTTTTTTEGTRRRMLKNYIFPIFGKFNIQDLDEKKLQRFFNEQVRKYSSDTVHKIKNLLNNFFKYAVKQHLINENPMTDIIIRRDSDDIGDDKTRMALRPEIRKVVFNAVNVNPILKPIIITFSFTGLRPQEICALKWSDVSLDEKTISVKRALKRVLKFDDDWNVVSTSMVIGKTKTPKSVRSIAIPDVVVTVLKEWILYCDENNIQSEYVFPNTETGEFRTYSGLRSILQRFIKRNKLEDENITLYTFRHTFATILLEERENPRIVADMMGHVKVSTTLDQYSHVVSNTIYEQTARTLDNVYAKLKA
jgi:integrase